MDIRITSLVIGDINNVMLFIVKALQAYKSWNVTLPNDQVKLLKHELDSEVYSRGVLRDDEILVSHVLKLFDSRPSFKPMNF